MWELSNCPCWIMKRIYDVLHRPFALMVQVTGVLYFWGSDCEGEPLKASFTRRSSFWGFFCFFLMFFSVFHRYQAKSWGQIISTSTTSSTLPQVLVLFFGPLWTGETMCFVCLFFFAQLLNWCFPFFFYICIQPLSIQKVILYVPNMSILFSIAA